MKNFKLIITAIVITFSLVGNAQQKLVPDSVFVYKNTKQGELKMDVFKPKNHNVSEQTPVVVFFFGGGWARGKTSQFYQQARYFADNGILAISAEYRVSTVHKTTPFECVIDGKSAIRYIREHASELGIDPNRIIASGGSAGGHVAACTGVIKGFDEATENLEISSLPNAMILFNPVVDTTKKGYGAKKFGNRATEVSPVSHVTKDIVPTIIFHGTADTTVPFENVERFTELMKDAGNTCELVPFERRYHGFFNGTSVRKNGNNVAFNKTMEMSMDFLKKNKITKK